MLWKRFPRKHFKNYQLPQCVHYKYFFQPNSEYAGVRSCPTKPIFMDFLHDIWQFFTHLTVSPVRVQVPKLTQPSYTLNEYQRWIFLAETFNMTSALSQVRDGSSSLFRSFSRDLEVSKSCHGQHDAKLRSGHGFSDIQV